MAQGEFPDPSVLGAVMRSLRMESGLSFRVLSAASGVSKSNIQRIEEGQADPTFMQLDRMLGVIGIEWGPFGDRIEDFKTMAQFGDHSQVARERMRKREDNAKERRSKGRIYRSVNKTSRR